MAAALIRGRAGDPLSGWAEAAAAEAAAARSGGGGGGGGGGAAAPIASALFFDEVQVRIVWRWVGGWVGRRVEECVCVGGWE